VKAKLKRQNKVSLKRMIVAIIILLFLIGLIGCAVIRDKIAVTKEELIGQNFKVSVYDHYANKTLEVDGDKITVGLLENDANIDITSTGYPSNVLEITVNGSQMFQVGNPSSLQRMDWIW